jgi:hypothetical protein
MTKNILSTFDEEELSELRSKIKIFSYGANSGVYGVNISEVDAKILFEKGLLINHGGRGVVKFASLNGTDFIMNGDDSYHGLAKKDDQILEILNYDMPSA